MIAVKVAAALVALAALVLTFRAKFVIENILHREATDGMVLRVKYVALALAIIAFISVFIFK